MTQDNFPDPNPADQAFPVDPNQIDAGDIAQLEQRIVELEAEIDAHKDQALRALAEAENTRRRTEREKEDSQRYAIATLARDLLSVADNLRRALDSLPADQVEDERVKNLLVGVQATERELLANFERRGIKRIEPLGEMFDPNFHEAAFEAPNTGKPAGTVVQVLQPGYLIFDRLLRPAMVGVAKNDGGNGRINTTA